MKELEIKYLLSLDEDKQIDELDKVFDRIFSKVWTTYSGEGVTTISGLSSVGAYTKDSHSHQDTLISSFGELGRAFDDLGMKYTTSNL